MGWGSLMINSAPHPRASAKHRSPERSAAWVEKPPIRAEEPNVGRPFGPDGLPARSGGV